MIQTHKAFLDAYLQEEKQVEAGLQAFYHYLDKHIARIGNKCETLKAIEDMPSSTYPNIFIISFWLVKTILELNIFKLWTI